MPRSEQCRRLLGCAALMLPLPAASIGSDASGATDVAATAARITQGLPTERQRAVAIHDFVRDQVKFGFTGRFYAMTAADVLGAGRGYCNTKSTLFVDLLRAAGLQARQQFVDIDASVLHGLVDPGTPWVDHSDVEVRIDGA